MTASPSFELPPPALISACLDDMVRGLADRPGLTHEQKVQRGAEAMMAMLSLQPSDGMQLMLAGQTVLFSSLAAEAGQDAARASTEAFRLRAQSNAIALGRMAMRTLTTLARLRGKTAPARAARPAAAGQTPASEAMGSAPAPEAVDRAPDPNGMGAAMPPPRPDMPPPSGVMPILPAQDAAPAAPTPHATHPPVAPRRPAEETHWLDEPYQEWLLETPANLARHAALTRSREADPERTGPGEASPVSKASAEVISAETEPSGIYRAAA